MKKVIKFSAFLIAVLMVSSVAFAASPWTEGATYSEKVKGKLDFGLKNVLGGWSELISEPLSGKSLSEAAVGLGKGVYNAVTYTVGGVLHLATFPIVQVDVPLPDNGVQF